MRNLLIIICGVLLASCSPEPQATGATGNEAATTAAGQSEEASALRLILDEKAPGWLESYDVPSVAVAYVEDGKLAWTAVFGEQSPGVPATAETLYNIASLAKPITAETILRLVSAGKISLGEPMSGSWVHPDLADDPWHNKATPALALSHRAGFINWRSQPDEELEFRWEPGTTTRYSGEGYNYVARFAEKKLEQSFEALAREYVFDPIGMENTSYTKRDWFAGRVAVPQGPEGEYGEPDTPMTWNAADNVHTTTTDYAKFLISVMNREMLTNELAAKRTTLYEDNRDLAYPPVEISPDLYAEHVGFGLGWMIFDSGNDTIIMHGGGDWGERTLGFYIPERGMGAVVFTNGANGQKIIRDVVNLLYPDPVFVALLNALAEAG